MQPATKVNYFNHDFSTSSPVNGVTDYHETHDRHKTNIIIDHTQFYHADDN